MESKICGRGVALIVAVNVALAGIGNQASGVGIVELSHLITDP